MNKNELIKSVSKQSSLSQKEAKEALDAITSLIKDALNKGEEIKIMGFGKFEVKDRSERITINPKTKQKMIIPKTKVASFKASKNLKDALIS